jgi:hypothetical protein
VFICLGVESGRLAMIHRDSSYDMSMSEFHLRWCLLRLQTPSIHTRTNESSSSNLGHDSPSSVRFTLWQPRS